MRKWPSIIPGTREDFYIVVNHYGKFGAAFAETRGSCRATITSAAARRRSSERVVSRLPAESIGEVRKAAAAPAFGRRHGKGSGLRDDCVYQRAADVSRMQTRNGIGTHGSRQSGFEERTSTCELLK